MSAWRPMSTLRRASRSAPAGCPTMPGWSTRSWVARPHRSKPSYASSGGWCAGRSLAPACLRRFYGADRIAARAGVSHCRVKNFVEAAMEKFLAKWKGLCGSSRVLRFVDINLRGIGQVMFQDNPLTGALFLIAIAWGSYAAGVPQVTIAGVVAVIVATLTALWLRVDGESLNAGLFGFNAVLVGLALATFLASGPLLWVYVILG